MSLFLVDRPSPVDYQQGRLMQLAAAFLLLFSIVLTLSPAARLHSWDADLRWNHWIGFGVWLVGSTLVHRQIIRRFPERDPFLFPITALLSGWGLLTIWRLDAVMGTRQTIWLAISLLVMWAGLYIPNLIGLLRRYKYLWLTSALLLTGLTFFIGTFPGGVGPRLWIGCCGVYLQPSEPLKLLLIVYLAAYLADEMPISFSLSSLLTPTIILAGSALALLVAQRDLGTASLFILIYTVITFLASGRRRILIFSAVVLLTAGITGYALFDVVRIRVDAWLNPWLDPSGRSFQIVQSILAVAAGDFVGRGPGLGSPGVVPVSHSDFIFAAIAEETGLLGVVGLLLLYALIVGRGFRAALFAPNNYQRYLAGGLTAYLVIQAIFIMGGNLRLLPLTGVTLPFVSYGGSSLLTAFVSMLLLLLVSNPEENAVPLQRQTPFLLISALLLAGLTALALISSWWSMVRDGELLARADNPRRSISERFVPRGALLDRANQPINQTRGSPGAYLRSYEYPPLSAVTGYSSPEFGQAGLEAGLDDYLRGLRGTPSSTIAWNYLLYGQPPPGLNVRLTLDLDLQAQADRLLEGRKGALVLLNATSGEVLVMASHPTFDPGSLPENWLNLLADENAPLLNRATQGQYPPGTALGPFLLSYAFAENRLPSAPNATVYQSAQGAWACARVVDEEEPTWQSLVQNGCPAPLVTLANNLDASEMEALFESLGFYQTAELPLPQAVANSQPVEQVNLAAIGQDNLVVTPLQMALAAAAISNNGIRPAPQIAGAVQTAQQGWLALPEGDTQATLLAGGAQAAAETLTRMDAPFWQALGTARGSGAGSSGAVDSEGAVFTWLLAGTLPNWQGTPLALTLVLEEDAPALAEETGLAVLQAAIQ